MDNGWWFGTSFIFSIQLGMSSSQVTNMFQRGRYTTNQIVLINLNDPYFIIPKRGFISEKLLSVSQSNGQQLQAVGKGLPWDPCDAQPWRGDI